MVVKDRDTLSMNEGINLSIVAISISRIPTISHRISEEFDNIEEERKRSDNIIIMA